MQHKIPVDEHGPWGKTMGDAVQACVHCGFCLAACPTYQELGQEMDSPRGRIVLMKEVLEGTLPWEAADVHVDRCLGCLACETACPSGVPYRDLISPFRAIAQGRRERPAMTRLQHFLTAQTLPHPVRFRFAARLGKWMQPLQFLLPKELRSMLSLLPAQLPPRQHRPQITPAQGQRRGRVALLTGCVQEVLAPDINAATIEVLARNGVEVVIPAGQGCCGALGWHTGDTRAAQKFARNNLDAFPTDVDAIVTNAAGCGSAMHEYHRVLAGTPDEARADEFRHRVMDVSVYLTRLGIIPPVGKAGARRRVAYHDACHLAHAQNVRHEPRALLLSIPNTELLELANSHLCCGSAGTYNLDQPEIAASLGRQKAESVIATGCDVVATGNIGCLNQLQVHLAKLGSPIQVRHTFQVLRDAYQK